MENHIMSGVLVDRTLSFVFCLYRPKPLPLIIWFSMITHYSDHHVLVPVKHETKYYVLSFMNEVTHSPPFHSSVMNLFGKLWSNITDIFSQLFSYPDYGFFSSQYISRLFLSGTQSGIA